ncbi:MAG TPA: hypothetical protein VG028_13875 [Terriglobia bacterium]|nr:hypothetical protein [Terriglobia bacterium]
MRADRVEVSFDKTKNNWVVRIQSGEEVIRRHRDIPQNADDQALRLAAQTAAQDEGYEADLAAITIKH